MIFRQLKNICYILYNNIIVFFFLYDTVDMHKHLERRVLKYDKSLLIKINKQNGNNNLIVIILL